MKKFRELKEEVSTPPIGVRSLYTKMYAKHGGTASKTKDAQSKAYDEVEKKHGKEMRDSLEAYHKKNMNEAVKDKFDIGEYDQEGDMAKSDLRSILANAKRVHDMLEDSDNLPEWVQSKITKAEDYMSTVANYMEAEMNEEVEQIDELKKITLTSYINKASGSAAHHGRSAGVELGVGGQKRKDIYNREEDKVAKRLAGIRKATSRITKEEVELDESIASTVGGLVGQYAGSKIGMEGPGKEHGALAGRMIDYHARKFLKKIKSAVTGQKNEEVESLEEKNVPTSPEKWAQAKAQAKAKFDVYPSAYANGWAAKKYKEMGGGWKSVSEEVKKDDLPFTPDKPTKKSVVVGKKPEGYSIARQLARQGMKKYIKPVKEEKDMSKKAQIVKSVMKKDKFEANPIISKTVDDKQS